MADILTTETWSPSARMELATDGERASQLSQLAAQATLKYSVKDYNAAAELYSQATELQAEINGEMSPQNADLLYTYGRCLYHVAVKNSDVLGSKVAGEKQEDGSQKTATKRQSKENKAGKLYDKDLNVAEETYGRVAKGKDDLIKPDVEGEKAGKPFFTFTGDENWDTSEEEDDGEEPEGEVEDADEEDDFVNAYEVLDLARILLFKRIEEAGRDLGKGKETGEVQEVYQLKERLADTYDLQAEISLEGERFPNAVIDLRSALELKKALFPQDSSLIAEAHYKLSLALEFSSVTRQNNANGEVDAEQEAHIDEAMRAEAAQEMEAAIASCKLRTQREEARFQDSSQASDDAGKPKITKGDINDAKEMVKEMEQRLVELRQPPVSLIDPRSPGTIEGSNPLSGILGSILGDSPAAQKARLEEASKGANDLTNLVKRKKSSPSKPPEYADPETIQANGKRKADSVDGMGEVGLDKKARIRRQ